MGFWLGPIYFLKDSSPENLWTGIGILGLVAMGVVVIAKVRTGGVRLAIAVFLIALWIAAGIIGHGIGA